MGSDQTFDTSAAEPVPVPTQLVSTHNRRSSAFTTHLQSVREHVVPLQRRWEVRVMVPLPAATADLSYSTDPPARSEITKGFNYAIVIRKSM